MRKHQFWRACNSSEVTKFDPEEIQEVEGRAQAPSVKSYGPACVQAAPRKHKGPSPEVQAADVCGVTSYQLHGNEHIATPCEHKQHLSQHALGPQKSLFKECEPEARMPKGRWQKACGISASSPQQGLRSTGGGPERVDIGGLHGFSCSETWPVKKGVSPLALLAVPSLLWHSHLLRLPVTLHCCSDPVLSRGLALLWGLAALYILFQWACFWGNAVWDPKGTFIMGHLLKLFEWPQWNYFRHHRGEEARFIVWLKYPKPTSWKLFGCLVSLKFVFSALASNVLELL